LEQRRAQRRAALIRAAIGVYGARGYRHATVRAVCEAAGITERYFYESFPNSEALLVACFQTVNGQLLDTMARAASDCPGGPDTKAAALLQAYYRTLQQSPGGARVFLVEIAGVSPAMDRVLAEALDQFGRLLERTMNPAVGDGGAALLRAGVVGGVVHIALAWIAGGYAEPLAAVVAQAQRLCAVLAPAPARR